MWPYKKVARILLILSALKFALAAPVPVKEIHKIRVHVLDIARDRTTASQTWPDLSMNGAGWTNGPPSLRSSDSGHQWEQEQHNTRSKEWETPGPSNPELPTPIPGDDSHSSSRLPSSARDEPYSLNPSSTLADIDLNLSPSQHEGATDGSHALNLPSPHGHIDSNMDSNSSPLPNSGLTTDVHPQAHPDPLASSPHDFINSPFHSSESAPGSAHDTPTQAPPDPLASSSVHDFINSLFYSSPSSESAPGSAHDTPPQPYPDPLASSSTHDFINSPFYSSPSPDSVPGSAHDTPTQVHPVPLAASSLTHGVIHSPSSSLPSSESTSGLAHDTPSQGHPDPVGSSAQNHIDLVSSSSESTPGSPLDTHPQAHSDPLTPSSAHDIADSDLPPPSPGPTDNHLWPVPPSDPGLSIGPLLKIPFLSTEEYHPLSLGPADNHREPSNPPPSAQSPDGDSEMVDLEHPPPASPTGLHTLPSAQSPDEASKMIDLDKILKTPFLSTEEYHPPNLRPTDNHLPPASPSNPGPSTGLHTLPQPPDEDSEMVDLDKLLKTPFLSTEEYHPPSLGPTDNHPPPASPSNPGPSTGPQPPPSAQSSHEDSEMADLEMLLKNPFLSTEEYHPPSLEPTDNSPLSASPSNPGPSTGPLPPIAEPLHKDSAGFMTDLENLLKNPFLRPRLSGSGA